jgi:hypothetical protein
MSDSVPRPAASAAGQDANAVYSLGSSAGESARLQRQADELGPASAALLDRAGLRPGHSAIDLGGGAVAAAEPDTEHVLCYPPNPAFDRICEIFAVAFSRNGADPAIGRRVPELFRQVGLTSVGVESRTQMYPPGNSRRAVRLDLVNAMRGQIVEMGLASGQELDELDAVARPHLEDPRTVVMSGLLFLAWGRKPG